MGGEGKLTCTMEVLKGGVERIGVHGRGCKPVGSNIIKDFCLPVPNLSSVTKGPFGIPKGTKWLIVIKACRPSCVYIGGMLIVTPFAQWLKL